MYNFLIYLQHDLKLYEKISVISLWFYSPLKECSDITQYQIMRCNLQGLYSLGNYRTWQIKSLAELCQHLHLLRICIFLFCRGDFITKQVKHCSIHFRITCAYRFESKLLVIEQPTQNRIYHIPLYQYSYV